LFKFSIVFVLKSSALAFTIWFILGTHRFASVSVPDYTKLISVSWAFKLFIISVFWISTYCFKPSILLSTNDLILVIFESRWESITAYIESIEFLRLVKSEFNLVYVLRLTESTREIILSDIDLILLIVTYKPVFVFISW